jgi:peptide/nickel transport system permease protein
MKIFKLIVERLIIMVVTIFILITVVFFALSFMPADPVSIICGPGATEESIRATRKEFGLDDPSYIQYFTFLKNLVQGNFGFSWRSRNLVIEEIKSAIPYTAILAATAMMIATVLGILTGTISAKKQFSLIDNVSMGISLIGVSTPIFILALFIIYIFAYRLEWFPTSGSESIRHLILPSVCLGLFVAASIARLVRASMLDILRQDYIRTARAKGLSEVRVIFKHAFRNALIPILTIVGMQFGLLLGGSVITETVFAWPGLGRLIITSINFKDAPLLQGGVLFFASGFMLINLITDILYQFIDPRIKIK